MTLVDTQLARTDVLVEVAERPVTEVIAALGVTVDVTTSATVDIQVAQYATVDTSTPGPRGIPGPEGPRGLPGATGAANGYVYAQTAQASTWVVANPLGRFPSVAVYADNGRRMYPDEIYSPETATLTLVFATPRGGTVVFA